MKEIEHFYDQQWSSGEKAAEARQFLLIFDSAIHYSYELLGELKGKKLLEIGCGTGDQLGHFALQGAKVVGIDISKESLNSAQMLLKERKLAGKVQEMNAERLEFAAGTFDVVYINSMLMHVDHHTVMEESKRVLKDGGKLVILEPLKYNPLMMIYRLFSPYRKIKPKYMSVGEFRDFSSMFQEFSHQEFYFCSLLSLLMFRKNPTIALSMSKKLERIDAVLGKILPPLRKLYWVSVVRYGKALGNRGDTLWTTK